MLKYMTIKTHWVGIGLLGWCILVLGCNSGNNHSNEEQRASLVSKLAAGGAIYNQQCKSCHQPLKSGNQWSYAFAPEHKTYLYQYLTRQDSLLKAKDAYTLELKAKWNNVDYLHDFVWTEDEFEALYSYVLLLK